MRNFFLGILVVNFCSQHCIAQEDYHVTDVFKVNLITPGVNYEKAIGRLQTISAYANMGMALLVEDAGSVYNGSGFYAFPQAGVQLRQYYGYKRRIRKARPTALNSLNYFGVAYNAGFSKMPASVGYIKEDKLRVMNSFKVHWGFERNYANHLSIHFYVGFGYDFLDATGIDKNNNKYTEVWRESYPDARFTLGWWLGKRE